MLPKVTVNAAIDMVELSLFDGKNRLVSSQAASSSIVLLDAIRANGGIPMVEVRFHNPEDALRIGHAALDLWHKWKALQEQTSNSKRQTANE